MTEAPPAIEFSNVVKRFGENGNIALDGISLAVPDQEFLAVVGASGSGKTTLLQLLGGLDRPSAGRVLVRGEPISELGPAEQGRLRNEALGFVYQFHHLLPEFSAVENVAMPLLVRGDRPARALADAGALLERVGLKDRLNHRPTRVRRGSSRILKIGPSASFCSRNESFCSSAPRIMDRNLNI